MPSEAQKWLRISIVNLGLVAFIGFILRYKIAFSLPFIDQKNLLHGHSHFAFAGWISQALMVLMVWFLHQNGRSNAFSHYKWLLIGNLFAAYGMLIAFPIQGYGPISITFSTLSVLISYVFSWVFWKDMNRFAVTNSAIWWFKAALIFNTLSSIGTFYLAYSMVNQAFDQKQYLASVYFYLHFQYNGWFFFACIGLLSQLLATSKPIEDAFRTMFLLFFPAAFPAYLLSTLWWPLPNWVLLFVFFAALAQCYSWVNFLVKIWKLKGLIIIPIPTVGKNLLLLSAVALSIKLMLQLGSTYPPLSQLAFGFRPIVIGYLHLVLLGIITLFLVGYSYSVGLLKANSLTTKAIFLFTAGIIGNEILLMSHGLAALNSKSLHYVNELLLAAAVVMVSGLGLLVWSQFGKRDLGNEKKSIPFSSED